MVVVDRIQPEPRIPLLQIGGQRPGGQRLADRHGMDPDRFLAVDVERHRQVAEALAEAADVFVVTNRLIEEVRRDEDEHDERQEAIQEVHDGWRVRKSLT